MEFNRKLNSVRNIIFGSALKLYQILMPFLMRTVMLYVMGIQYLGLNSLFASIIQVLNLAELGVGSAMIFSMYKPVAEGNDEEICGLMLLYKKYYRIIGTAVLVLCLCLMPFIGNLVKTDTVPPDINIYILYALNLMATVSSYWLFAYKNAVIQAHQREDIISKVTLLVTTCLYIVQILLLIAFHNYYFYVIAIIMSNIAINICTAIFAEKMYPQYKARGSLPKSKVKEINKRVRDLFTARIGSVIVESADTIVISAFLGLTVLAQYQNYYFIITALIGLITVILSSSRAGIGNSLVTETKEKNFFDFKRLTLIIFWICTTVSAILLAVFQPFIKLWAGEENLLSYSIVVCIVIYFFISQMNGLFNLYKDAAGIWNKDKYRTLITALSNLCLNLLTVRWLGLYGVILSTVVSTVVIGIPWILHNLFTTVFDKKQLGGFVKQIIVYVIIAVASGVITAAMANHIDVNNFVQLILGGVLGVIVSNILMIALLFKTDTFKSCIELVKDIVKFKRKV